MTSSAEHRTSRPHGVRLALVAAVLVVVATSCTSGWADEGDRAYLTREEVAESRFFDLEPFGGRPIEPGGLGSSSVEVELPPGADTVAELLTVVAGAGAEVEWTDVLCGSEGDVYLHGYEPFGGHGNPVDLRAHRQQRTLTVAVSSATPNSEPWGSDDFAAVDSCPEEHRDALRRTVDA